MNNQKQTETVGQRIKKLRQEKGETQVELGDAIGLSQNSISKIESGEISLTLQSLLNISKHYHVSTDYLCTGSDKFTLLETLTKFISLEYAKTDAGLERFEYPVLNIDKVLFTYLMQSAFIDKNQHHIPDNIRREWLEKERDNFYKHNKGNDHSHYESIVPLPQEFIYPDDEKNEWKQSDLIREVTRYFSTLNTDTSNKDSNN